MRHQRQVEPNTIICRHSRHRPEAQHPSLANSTCWAERPCHKHPPKPVSRWQTVAMPRGMLQLRATSRILAVAMHIQIQKKVFMQQNALGRPWRVQESHPSSVQLRLSRVPQQRRRTGTRQPTLRLWQCRPQRLLRRSPSTWWSAIQFSLEVGKATTQPQ
jgi:hypothetical protein